MLAIDGPIIVRSLCATAETVARHSTSSTTAPESLISLTLSQAFCGYAARKRRSVSEGIIYTLLSTRKRNIFGDWDFLIS